MIEKVLKVVLLNIFHLLKFIKHEKYHLFAKPFGAAVGSCWL
jgi:hypothetical protein